MRGMGERRRFCKESFLSYETMETIADMRRELYSVPLLVCVLYVCVYVCMCVFVCRGYLLTLCNAVAIFTVTAFPRIVLIPDACRHRLHVGSR